MKPLRFTVKLLLTWNHSTCYEEFTAGQQTRMTNQWNTYRASFQTY
jgi:hypothetical protein